MTATVELSGPFFTHDPGKTLRGNIQSLMAALADEMEGSVKGDIEAASGSMPLYSGWTHDHVVGRVASLNGKHWLATAVVSANTARMGSRDATRTLAAASSIEARFHPFRNTVRAVRSSRVWLRDLAKGLE